MSFAALGWQLLRHERGPLIATAAMPDAPESGLGPNARGSLLALGTGMKEPSAARKRTLALHDRALRFSTAVNTSCPKHFSDVPSSVVWTQLVRAADSTSNNLIEADAASSDADFLHKMGLALREAKEAGASLAKIRMGRLDHCQQSHDRKLEAEANQLASILAAIILNMRLRLDEQNRRKQTARRTSTSN
ncbi:MAG TPA: four helix bundle protein [Vicinamibacterales bacterium]|nr:four helix bundle protein [Vicinamibacterales bacterium]